MLVFHFVQDGLMGDHRHTVNHHTKVVSMIIIIDKLIASVKLTFLIFQIGDRESQTGSAMRVKLVVLARETHAINAKRTKVCLYSDNIFFFDSEYNFVP